MDFVTLYLQKMGTIISDRRAVNYAVAVVLALVALPYSADKLAVDSELVGTIVTIIQGAVILLGSYGLTKSWEKRLPSGLKYKDILEAEMKLKAAITAILASDNPDLQMLRDILIEFGLEPEN